MKIIKILLIMLIILVPINAVGATKKLTVKELKMNTKELVIKIIREESKRIGVEKEISITFAKIESDFRPEVFNSNDPSHGLFQLAFETGTHFNKRIKTVKDLYNPRENAIAGIRFIKHLIVTYPNASIGEIAQMYNLGETKFKRGVRNADYERQFLKWYDMYKQSPISNSTPSRYKH